MIIIGCFLRYWTTGTCNFFMSPYFKVYSNNFKEYSDLTAIASFVGGLFSTFTAGLIIDYFEPRSEMTIPMLCLIKAVIDIPFLLMTYFQQSSFIISELGIFLQYFFAKGWTSAAILILKTVVDPSIASLSISMFMLTASLVSTIAAISMGNLAKSNNLNPVETPTAYGELITFFTVVPTVLSIPFFYYSGLAMRDVKRKQIAKGELSKPEMQKQIRVMKKMTMFGDENFATTQMEQDEDDEVKSRPS